MSGENLPEVPTPGRNLSRTPRKSRLKKPSFPFVIVIWDDANKDVMADILAKDIDHKPSRLYTVGWLLRDDEAGSSVASEWCPEDNTWRSISFIPKGMLVEIRGLQPR